MWTVKPEVTAPAGSIALDSLQGSIRWNDPALSVVGAGGERPERLLALGVGTSFAAPLVSHAALRVLGRYPSLSANAVRALVVASVEPLDLVLRGGTNTENARQQRRLTGYGRVSVERAVASEDHRAVLLADDELPVNNVHLYTVPIPSTFFESGGQRTLTVVLAYDPQARSTRLDYLASRMMVRAYRGVSSDDVKDAYAQQIGSPGLESSADDAEEDQVPPSLRRFEEDLQPSDKHRARGAHQFGRRVFSQRLNPERGTDLILAVRNTNKWALPEDGQRYALAVVLERDDDHRPLYTELRTQLESLAEVEVEIEL